MYCFRVRSPGGNTRCDPCRYIVLWVAILCAPWIAANEAPTNALHAYPIQFQRVEKLSPEGWMRGLVARLDLRSSHLEFDVTPALQEPDPPAEARLIPVDQWANDRGLDFAINANFFAWKPEGYADVLGLSVSQGAVVSPPRAYRDVWDSALVIKPGNDAEIWRRGRWGADQLPLARFAVSGIGPTDAHPDRSGPILWRGAVLGAHAQVQPNRRHPRTAIGLSQDGERLIAFVVDGRQPGWSVGATLPELGAWMHELGAWSALNLDGGGSTSMVVRDPKNPDQWHRNRPSDAQGFRPVANHFGARVTKE